MEKDSDFLAIFGVKNVNWLIIRNLNINSIWNKFDQLNIFVPGKVDILITMETKLNSTFDTPQLW